jgi:hypothetical protein
VRKSLEVIVVDADLVVGGGGDTAARVQKESGARASQRTRRSHAASYGASYAVATEQVVARRWHRSSSRTAGDMARANGQGWIKETIKMFMIHSFFSEKKRAMGAYGPVGFDPWLVAAEGLR